MSPAFASATGAARLSDADALGMYRELSIHELGRRALARCQHLHPEPYRTYVVDRNINYSNVCTARCTFCNFSRPPGSDQAYVLTCQQIGQKIEELLRIGGTQILMQGGLLPDQHHPSGHGRPFQWYLDLLGLIRSNYPSIHIHAFSPPEIWAFHQRFRLPLRDVLLRLREAGLDTIPGGGAEILVDEVRRQVSPRKCSTAEWLDVMRTAHRLGMRTTATMMFGHVETCEDRIVHLLRVRELQDETGGFTAFIPWTFQPKNTQLRCEPVGGFEYLKTLAISRLMLDNVPNIQASWVTQGAKIGQLALAFGANDMGSIMIEENVVRAAGCSFRMTTDEIRRLISDAGFEPRQRDCYYRLVR